ncbi:MAG: ABC transporter substrate-binding protein [Caldilineaceae bacterium]|nr:ABC transporter substrate-binding protein [Caldilineaceae bacterium]
MDTTQTPVATQPTTGRVSRRTMLKQALFLGAALPLALAACTPVAGVPQPNPAATTTPTQPAVEAQTVRLTYGTGGLPLFAKTRGDFEKTLQEQGIAVEWLGPFPNHAPTLQAVVGGTADFSFGGSTTPALAAIIAGSPLVFTSLILTDPRTSAILVLPDSGITSVADLAGKSVAANRSGLGEFLLIAALEKYNVPLAEVEIAYLNPPDAAPAFAQAQVDAWSIWSSFREIAEVEYGAIAIFDEGKDLTKAEQVDAGSFLVLDSYANENPDLIRAVLAAYHAEALWGTANPVDAVNLLAAEAGWTQPVIDKQVAYARTYTLIEPTDTEKFDLQAAADWLTAHAVLPEAIVVADHFAKL